MPENIILIHGKPGAGKSTCCQQAVAEAPQWAQGHTARHLSVGHYFRSILTAQTPSRYTREVQLSVAASTARIASMALPAHLLVQNLVEEYISGLTEPGVTLIDGYPREPELIELIVAAEKRHTFRVLGCISLDVCSEVAVARQMARATEDASHPAYTEEDATQRIEVYEKQAAPVLHSLGELYGLETIDGNAAPEIVSAEFTAALDICLSRAGTPLAV